MRYFLILLFIPMLASAQVDTLTKYDALYPNWMEKINKVIIEFNTLEIPEEVDPFLTTVNLEAGADVTSTTGLEKIYYMGFDGGGVIAFDVIVDLKLVDGQSAKLIVINEDGNNAHSISFISTTTTLETFSEIQPSIPSNANEGFIMDIFRAGDITYMKKYTDISIF